MALLEIMVGVAAGTLISLHIIDRARSTIRVTAAIGSAVTPTMIAQTWFQPDFKPIAKTPEVLEAGLSRGRILNRNNT